MSGDSSNNDDDAIRRVLSGDREAFRALVDKYGSRVISFCRSRLGSDEEARDAAQEVFIRAYSSLATFRRGESFAAWLFAIAANRVRTRFHIFSMQRRKAEAAAVEAAAAPVADPAEEAERSMRAEGLRRAVSALPPDLRWPVEFFYFAELSVAETARVLGLGDEAVKTRLFRARAALRRNLEDKQPKRGLRGSSI
jgi:RNA polymerase sigma factor (sigma-70 family)